MFLRYLCYLSGESLRSLRLLRYLSRPIMATRANRSIRPDAHRPGGRNAGHLAPLSLSRGGADAERGDQSSRAVHHPASSGPPDRHRLRGHRRPYRGQPLVRASRYPRVATARPHSALLPGTGARAADPQRIADGRRHCRFVGAQHRGLRRGGQVVRRRSDSRCDDADRHERRSPGD